MWALLTAELADAVCVPVLAARVDVEWWPGHLDAAEAASNEARALAESIGLRDVIADAFRDLAWLADPRRHSDETINLQRHGLEVAASVDEQRRAIALVDLGVSFYLQGIDSSEIISTVHGRRSPTISATAGLKLMR